MRRTPSTFGLSDATWDSAKAQLRAAILEAARARQMTWYSHVAAQVTAVHVDPFSALMNHLLGAILEDEHAADQPLLTAIVTHKDGDKEPGPGFYDMARSLGYRFDEPYVFWATQVQDIFKQHGQPRRRSSQL
ncbi:hypothetical protein JOF56_003051 [Kibdelosporangium banguiense]|uniref:Uncharacterized protein n=1 Tax=Kibdelosporangium banguiense TaxID=1365924 RepID=A0ABS4TE25_9PSEU|nr:hypothetical protein [Kibdelosporangium banguiense]MBP2322666.1 hypothetical protein [Kibdelosporangium banguiense]